VRCYLDRPTAGQVCLKGQDAWAWGDGRRAQARLAEIGFVFQTNNLFDYLDVRRTWRSPPGSSAAHDRRPYAGRTDCSSVRTRGAGGCPGRAPVPGEAQRVATARALINRPALVLADEPTGSLDSENGARVQEALSEVCAAGVALVVVTHDLTVAARGRVTQMRDGRTQPAPG
jgi:putative ABC transport system ATP-binding protein